MWDQLTTFWSLDRAEKHYSLKEQPLNMPLGSQNPYAKRAYWIDHRWSNSKEFKVQRRLHFLRMRKRLSRGHVRQKRRWYMVGSGIAVSSAVLAV